MQKESSAVPDQYYSRIGLFWRDHSVVLWTGATLLVVFILGALLSYNSWLGLIFGLAVFGVLIGFPVSAFVSRKNARLKYEKESYNRRVTQYQYELAQAQKEREAAFRSAHDLWMTQQGRLKMTATATVDRGLVDRFKSSSVTNEIATWIKTEWENYGHSRSRDPQVQSFETFCEGIVEQDNVGVIFSLKDTQTDVIKNQYYFEQHKTQPLGTDENCAAVSAALAALLQGMNIDNAPVTVLSQNGSAFVVKRTAPNPNYKPPFRGW